MLYVGWGIQLIQQFLPQKILPMDDKCKRKILVQLKKELSTD